MPRTSYQYGTSPRKLEKEYEAGRTLNKKTTKKSIQKTITKKQDEKIEKKSNLKKEMKQAKRIQEGKHRFVQIAIVLTIFGMLLTLSYREISIMEMFNQKKSLENKLAVIQKENGQIEKNIKEVESTLDWNSIQQKATEQLGMKKKTEIPVDLEKTDNVETSNKLIKEEETSMIEKIIIFFINKK